jgi:hypothetical protein
MKCFLYMIEEGNGSTAEAVVKIGIGENVGARLSTLQTGNSQPLRIVTQWELRDRREARRCERFVHRELAADHIRGEWFRTNPIGAMCSIDEYLGLAE